MRLIDRLVLPVLAAIGFVAAAAAALYYANDWLLSGILSVSIVAWLAGHWLLAWVAGWLGAALAGHFYRGSKSRAKAR